MDGFNLVNRAEREIKKEAGRGRGGEGVDKRRRERAKLQQISIKAGCMPRKGGHLVNPARLCAGKLSWV